MKSVAVSKPDDAASHASAIERVIASIPRGRVASYGEIAQRAGLPGRARLVGRVLGESNRQLPWHRVLRSSGQSAFPPGSRGFREQSQLLRSEGVAIANGRVDMQRFGWQRDLDAELWGPPLPPTKSRASSKPSRDAQALARRR